ncbi:nucleotide exchange factor GrpE [Candidatus Dojkabacteria bacterium]|uniref:Protein GrpE n=1 Tax=Candidatus Dojkabacteria bacterium TaxID=2099670 RepID=A0A955I5H0_9BACT|nr:nucleotide exchange factor GrpE [Candidatus Dojkabacteria bacterium]
MPKKKPNTTQDKQEKDSDNTRITELEAQLAGAREQTLIARADLQNYRNRMEEERAKFGLLTNMQLVTQILEIVDDIQLALSDEGTEDGRAKEMLRISQDKLLAALQIAGVEKVEIRPGDKFDAHMMEAITTTPVAEPAQDNAVIAVVSSAFRYSGQENMLRTAKVIVGKLS